MSVSGEHTQEQLASLSASNFDDSELFSDLLTVELSFLSSEGFLGKESLEDAPPRL